MSALTGTAALTRLALRHDRVALPAWVLGLAGFTAAITAMSAHGLRTTADLVQETSLMANSPGMRLMGLASGASVGGYTMIRGYLTLAVLAALMSVLAVVRHTRRAEESGRADLIGAAVVGRHAGLAAALTVTVAANAALTVLLGLAMVANGQPAAGSFAAGAAVSAVGISFAGVAAVTSQLASGARGASGLAAAVLALAFLTSGVGNMAGRVDVTGTRVDSAWPAWLSPIGWGQQMRPFGGDRWWPLGLAVALLLVGAATAVVLAGRRDVGQGVLPQRAGHGRAGRVLRRPWGLPLRLQRGALIGWAVGMLGFGLVLGGIVGQVRNLTGAALDWYTRMGGTDRIVDAYRASVVEMAGMAVAIYVVQILLRMRSEEADGPLEPVLAAAVSRPRWAAGHAVAALVGATALLLLFATGMGLAAAGTLGDPAAQVWTLIGAALVQLPAILVIAAAVLALLGAVPRAAVAGSWSVVVASVLLGPLFGPSLGLPQWAQDLSPFTHIPKAPAVAVTATPVVLLAAVVAGLALLGFVALRRRDVRLPA
jgi:ABC-2 type transport system permease protein